MIESRGADRCLIRICMYSMTLSKRVSEIVRQNKIIIGQEHAERATQALERATYPGQYGHLKTLCRSLLSKSRLSGPELPVVKEKRGNRSWRVVDEGNNKGERSTRGKIIELSRQATR